MDRSEQNQALRDLDALVADIKEFDGAARRVLLRGRFSSGQKTHKRGELGATKPSHVDMTGTPGPQQSDPTGEDAIWVEKADRIGKTIESMASSLAKWHVMSQYILDLSSIDVAERAKRTVPDCLACGDPCHGKVRSGFDDKCYTRWLRDGRPDRVEFVAKVKADKETQDSDVPPL